MTLEQILEQLNERGCDYKCWLTHKDDDVGMAKSGIKLILLDMLPDEDTRNDRIAYERNQTIKDIKAKIESL